nr:tRNA:m(4)X modification enzyme TRM13 homolog isoform X2 [Vanessa tameamea]
MSKPSNCSETSSITPQCQYYVVRKKRLCRMTVRPGRQYCGEHEPRPKTDNGKDDLRIPCPNDPKHTCYASKLKKHLSICNARQQQQPDYIILNINGSTDTEDCPRLPLSKIPLKTISKVIDKVNILYDKYLKDKIPMLSEKPIHTTVLDEFNDPGRTESSLRHLRQASRLLHVVENEGFVKPNTCFIELGAGKDYALRCITSTGVLDKVSGVALATCCHHRCERAACLASRPLQGLGIDAEDFNVLLGVVSWATCGDGRSRDARKRPLADSRTHTRTQTRAEVTDDDGENYGTKNLNLSQERREIIGKRAKMLLDWGRVLYLKELGFDARLVYYVSSTVSLENVCILAKKIS